MTFILSKNDDWSDEEVALCQQFGKIGVKSHGYTKNTWVLSKTPGGFRFYAARCKWVRKYLQAGTLVGLLEQISPSSMGSETP